MRAAKGLNRRSGLTEPPASGPAPVSAIWRLPLLLFRLWLYPSVAGGVFLLLVSVVNFIRKLLNQMKEGF